MEQLANRIDQRRATIIGSIAAVHFVVCVALFFLMLASSMSRFDGAGPSDFADLLVKGAFQISSFPLVTGFLLLKIANTGVWGWLPVLANSVLWGWAGWRAIRFWRSRHKKAQIV